MGKNIPALTGFRGVAALLVVWNHLGMSVGLEHLRVVDYGFIGVPFFFCLSGALFAHLYFDRAELTPGFLRPYFLARLIRIYPAYLAVLAAHGWTTGYPDLGNLWAHLTLTHGFIGKYRDTINIPMWTLPVEATFYLAAPFVFVAMRAARQRWGKSLISLGKGWGTAIFDLGVLMGISILLLGVGAIAHRWTPGDADWWKGTLFGRFMQFGLGIWVGLHGFPKQPKPQTLNASQPATWPKNLVLLGGLVVLGALIEVLESSMGGEAGSMLRYLAKFCLAVPACAFIYAAVWETPWAAFLSTKLMVLLGEISYCLYLVQCLSLGRAGRLCDVLGKYFLSMGTGAYGALAAGTGVCVAIATGMHFLVERPVQGWLRGRWLGR